jgi:pilus assembly protein Flp/PilA
MLIYIDIHGVRSGGHPIRHPPVRHRPDRVGTLTDAACYPLVYRQLKILAQAPRDCFSETRRIRLRTLLSNLIRDESGVTAIEYALIAALIAVAAIAAFTLVGTSLSSTFSSIASQV